MKCHVEELQCGMAISVCSRGKVINGQKAHRSVNKCH